MRCICCLALVACSALAAPAQAGLTINLRFADGGTTKRINTHNVGQDYQIEVWASADAASGTNGSGDLFGLQYAFFSVLSERILAGPTGAIDGNLTASSLVAPFNTPQSFVGEASNLTDDGIGDWGSTSNASNSAYVKPRASSAIFSDNSAATGHATSNGFEFLIDRITFHVAGVPQNAAAGGGTRFNPFVPDNMGRTFPANWWQRSNGSPSGPGGSIPDGFNNSDALNNAGTSVSFLFGSDWQNAARPLDVDNNTKIEPLDVLQVVNDLNANGPRTLPAPSGGQPPPFLDTTGDGLVSPLDALQIINYLNAQPPSGLSGEAPPMVLVPEPTGAALALVAALGIVGMLWRRRAKRA